MGDSVCERLGLVEGGFRVLKNEGQKNGHFKRVDFVAFPNKYTHTEENDPMRPLPWGAHMGPLITHPSP